MPKKVALKTGHHPVSHKIKARVTLATPGFSGLFIQENTRNTCTTTYTGYFEFTERSDYVMFNSRYIPTHFTKSISR